MSLRLEPLKSVHETVKKLRAPDGCPWDKKQTHQSLRPYLIEEAYEVLEALDRDLAQKQSIDQLKEELGDLLMQVLLHAELASERGEFDFADVAEGLNDKLIRRHPHVFEREKGIDAKTEAEALKSWESRKAEEKKAEKKSVLDGLPKALPALQRTERLIEKVTQVGFQWPDLSGPIAKIDEELRELKEEIEALQVGKAKIEKVESELGDLLFTVANVGYLLKIHPEDALRGTLQKFERRFRYVETKIQEGGKQLTESTLAEMDHFWDEAKAMEAKK